MCEYELEKRIYVMDATIRHQTIKLLGAALSSLGSPTGLIPLLRTGLQNPSLYCRVLVIQKGRERKVPLVPLLLLSLVTLRSPLRTAEASPRAFFVLNKF